MLYWITVVSLGRHSVMCLFLGEEGGRKDEGDNRTECSSMFEV